MQSSTWKGRDPPFVGESAVTVGEKPEEYSIPKYLFRYRPFEDQFDSLRRILVNNEWYFGSRVAFDDQDDCKLPGILMDRDYMRSLMAKKDGGLTKDREDKIERFLADPVEAERRTVDEVQGYVNRAGILCLSELHEDPSYGGSMPITDVVSACAWRHSKSRRHPTTPNVAPSKSGTPMIRSVREIPAATRATKSRRLKTT